MAITRDVPELISEGFMSLRPGSNLGACFWWPRVATRLGVWARGSPTRSLPVLGSSSEGGMNSSVSSWLGNQGCSLKTYVLLVNVCIFLATSAGLI